MRGWFAEHPAPYVLPLILFIAGLVRYWGIGFGLPNIGCRPDESFIVEIIKSPMKRFHPGTFNYPSFYKYSVLAGYSAYYVYGRWSGKISSLQELKKAYVINPGPFYLIDRYLAAFAGVLTVLCVYHISNAMFDRTTSVISALFLALAYIHVRDSHFGTTDVPMTFLIMASMHYLVRGYKDGTASSLAISGALAGLATSTKYAGIIMIGPLCAMLLADATTRHRSLICVLCQRRMIYFAVAFVLAFVAGTPFAIIDFQQFARGLAYEMQHLQQGHGIILGRGWWYHLRYSLPYGLGYPLFAASLFGMLLMFKRTPAKGIILLSYPLLYYLMIGRGYTVFLRYIIPIVPFLCISAAVGIIYLADKARDAIGISRRWVFIFLNAAVILVPAVWNLIQCDILLSRKDNRVVASEWIRDNLSGGATIASIGCGFAEVQLPSTLAQLRREEQRHGRESAPILAQYQEERRIAGFEKWTYDRALGRFRSDVEVVDGMPDFIILGEYPLTLYASVTSEERSLIQRFYRPMRSFRALDIDRCESWFDQGDAFYLPFVGFRGVCRPGPNLHIYRRTDALVR